VTLPIEYGELVSLFLFIFAFVGLMRGWYKEGITSLFAAALALLVWRPEAARMLIGRITEVLKVLIVFIRAGLNPEPQALGEPSAGLGSLLDPNSYEIYVVITVVLLAVSYVVGEATFKQRMTALGRLLGAMLGAFNGYVILSLVKQFVINQVQVQAVGPIKAEQLSVQVTEVPTGSFFTGSGLIFIFIVVIGVIALMVAGDRLRLPLK
jgi:uncharacterized membrane protein required for colicin V production